MCSWGDSLKEQVGCLGADDGEEAEEDRWYECPYPGVWGGASDDEAFRRCVGGLDQGGVGCVGEVVGDEGGGVCECEASWLHGVDGDVCGA